MSIAGSVLKPILKNYSDELLGIAAGIGVGIGTAISGYFTGVGEDILDPENRRRGRYPKKTGGGIGVPTETTKSVARFIQETYNKYKKTRVSTSRNRDCNRSCKCHRCC